MTAALSLSAQLKSAKANVRRRARSEVRKALAQLEDDSVATAEQLGLSVAEVDAARPRQRRNAGRLSAAPSPGSKSSAAPFDDFQPLHRQPLSPRGPADDPPQDGGGGTRQVSEAWQAPRFPAGDRGPRRLALVLHAHLPWVLGHGRWPHGEEWLTEAAVHCYLPIVAALRRRATTGQRHLLTFSVTPVLAAQLADRRTRPLVHGYLEARIEAARQVIGSQPLARWWHDLYSTLAAEWEALDGDLIAALRDLETAGVIELSTSAATHAYLPLIHRQELIDSEIAAARQLHESLFGRSPDGIWMPECAYRPGGPWRHPVTGAEEAWRPGNEAFLQRHGLAWTVVDTHIALGGEPILPYAWQHLLGHPPPEEPRDEPTFNVPHPVWIGGSQVAAFVRDPFTARQVWSRHVGYPGDPRYLDFHKRHARSGLRLWRVSEAEADLADKLPYWPQEASAAVALQAEHFVELVSAVPQYSDGIVVCPFDAELFGHWWFEGPQWLEAVFEGIAAHPTVTTTTPRRELASSPPRARLRLREGSWGEGGDHRVWANPDTEWIWRELQAAENEIAALIDSAAADSWKVAALNQLLLLAASDWPFLITMKTGDDYAAERFREHRQRLTELVGLAATGGDLPPWVELDLPFPQAAPDLWSH